MDAVVAQVYASRSMLSSVYSPYARASMSAGHASPKWQSSSFFARLAWSMSFSSTLEASRFVFGT
jgi:hypothetical protein